MSKLELTVFTYGSNERRAEIELRPIIPDPFRKDNHLLDSWVKALSMTMAYDLKHTNAWGCAGCGEPARETLYDMASWIHLPQPRVVIYIHHLCEAGKNKCHQAISVQMRARTALITGIIPPTPPQLEKPDGMEYPLSSSCCNCRTDESVKFTSARCGGCKLVRYCGADCQNQDWKRHKKICKTIDSVKWVN